MLFAAVLIVSIGCSRVQFGSRFEEDGQVTHSISIVFDRDSLDPDITPWVESRLTQTEQQATEDGFAVERIDTDREVGLRVSNTLADSADAGAGLNALINSISLDETSGPVAPFSGTFMTGSGAVGGAAFELDMTVDGGVLMAAIAELMPPGRELPTGDGLAEVLDLSYVAVMPGRITDTNGQTIRSNTVRWTLPFDSRLTMRSESKLGEKGSVTWFIIAAIAGVAAVALIAGGIGLVILRRRQVGLAAGRPTDELDGAASAGAPETVIEAGASLGRAVGRVVSGEQVADVVGQPGPEPPEKEPEG